MASLTGHTFFVDQIQCFSGQLHNFVSQIRGSCLKIPQFFATSIPSQLLKLCGEPPPYPFLNRKSSGWSFSFPPFIPNGPGEFPSHRPPGASGALQRARFGE
jgi:hypothetical protein